MTTAQAVLIVGGTSDIGLATAHVFAAAGWKVQLTARDLDAAERCAADLRLRHAVEAEAFHLDILNTADFAGLLKRLGGAPDVTVCVVGENGDQARSQADPEFAQRVLRVNFEGPALLLDCLAAQMAADGEAARGRAIIAVSSVAGDRGRASNYHYGSAKAGFSAFLSGLRHRLFKHGIRVVTVKPGFIRTRMTAGMKLPPLVTGEPGEVGALIYRSASRGAETVYVRWIWRYIMWIIRVLPEPLFKRSNL